MKPTRLLAAVAAVVLAASFASAAVLHVPSEYGTIQAGIDAATEGDTVLVAPGDYAEHITLGTASITLLSASGDAVTFISAPTLGPSVIYFPPDAGNSSRIEGFTIRNGTGNGIRIEAGNSPTIYGCTLDRNRSNYVPGGGICGSADNCLIRRCRFMENIGGKKGGGIFIGEASGITIDSCYFEGNHSTNGGGAICLRNCSDVIFSYNVVVNNTVSDDLGGVVYSEYGIGLSIHNNTIVGNDFNENEPSSYGDGVGICVIGGDTAEVFNNIIAFNTDAHGVYVAGTIPDLRVEYNDVYENTTGTYLGVEPGAGSISADPEFAGMEQLNFYLLPTSVCIDAGDPSPEYNDPNGSRSDMGAFYFDETADSDGDGVLNINDNCLLTANPDQTDADDDGRGDACDECPYDADNDADNDGICGDVDACPLDSLNDIDGDGICGEVDPCPYDSLNDIDGDGVCGNVDNCPSLSNADQTDTDGDHIGDACDVCPNDRYDDADGDGYCADVDNCPVLSNPDQTDTDDDGIGDACDACPNDPQNDIDGDGICGDVDPCPFDPDNDYDGDGLCADVDNCPLVYNPGQADEDDDNVGDACDACPGDTLNDIDGDGLCTDVDPCPFDSLNDIDGDGLCADVDNCPFLNSPDQTDTDADGVGDLCDVCPTTYDPDQRDRDHDGVGDACCCVVRGDCDHNESVNVSDLTYLVASMFCGGPPIGCPASGDIDGSGAINVSDLTFLVAYLFQSGSPPPPCPDGSRAARIIIPDCN